MTVNGSVVSLAAAGVAALSLIVNMIVHWEKIRRVLFSQTAFTVSELVLLFICFPFGRVAIIVGANIYLLLVFADFIRKGDCSYGEIASTIHASAVGVFNFAMQFALAVNGK